MHGNPTYRLRCFYDDQRMVGKGEMEKGRDGGRERKRRRDGGRDG